MDQRIAAEIQSQLNPFVVTQHRQNYILPYSRIKEPNIKPDPDAPPLALKDEEAIETVGVSRVK